MNDVTSIILIFTQSLPAALTKKVIRNLCSDEAIFSKRNNNCLKK